MEETRILEQPEAAPHVLPAAEYWRLKARALELQAAQSDLYRLAEHAKALQAQQAEHLAALGVPSATKYQLDDATLSVVTIPG